MKNRLGISTNIFDNPKDLYSLVESFANNFTHIEIEFDFESRPLIEETDANLAVLEKLNELREAKGLTLTVHAPYKHKDTDLTVQDVDARKGAVEVMRKSIVAANRIGAKKFTFHPGFYDERTGNESREDIIIALSNSVAAMQKVADPLGIQLCLEYVTNHHKGHVALEDHTYSQFCATLGIGLTLDIVHFTVYTPDLDTHSGAYLDKLDVLMPVIANVHVADLIVPQHMHIPLDEGDLDYNALLHHFEQAGYHGGYIVETPNGRYQPEDYVAATLAYRDSGRLR